MAITAIPATPYGDIPAHWREWLDALDAWTLPFGLARPRIYFPAGDRDAILARIDATPGLRDDIVRAAEGALVGELPDPTENPPARALQGALGKAVACADGWLVSGDARFAERARKILPLAYGWKHRVAPEHLPLTIDLLSAHIIYGQALVRDRLDGAFPADEREALDADIVAHVEKFLRISDAHAEWWTYSLHNWRSVICGQYGIAALSAMEALPEGVLRRVLRHAIIGALVVLDQGDPDGGWFEGVGYWRYGVGEAVHLIDALERISGGAIDLFAHPFLRKTGDFGIYETWPDGRVHNWGDCAVRVNATPLLARLVRATGRADWQAYVRRFPVRPSMDTLFWDDPDLAPAPFESLPRAKRFRGTEVAVLRAGWGDDDLIVAAKAGRTTANHSHLDTGSLTITMAGTDLVGDGGSWKYGHALGMFDLRGPRWDFPGLATACHSTILVDGEGQEYGPERDGTIVACVDFPDYAYMTIDATRAYPQLAKFVRYVVLVRPDTVIVVDDLESPDRRRFGWRAILPHGVRRIAWPSWESRAPDGGPSLAIRLLLPGQESGLMAEETRLDATYPATGGLSEPGCTMLTVSPIIRSREERIVVAMRAGKGEPIEPAVRAELAYRSVRLFAETPSGPREWSIMWNEPGVQQVG